MQKINYRKLKKKKANLSPTLVPAPVFPPYYSVSYFQFTGELCFLVAQMVKNPPVIAGDPGSIPGSGRSPGIGNGSSLQYSCLESSMDREAWRAIVRGV